MQIKKIDNALLNLKLTLIQKENALSQNLSVIKKAFKKQNKIK